MALLYDFELKVDEKNCTVMIALRTSNPTSTQPLERLLAQKNIKFEKSIRTRSGNKIVYNLHGIDSKVISALKDEMAAIKKSEKSEKISRDPSYTSRQEAHAVLSKFIDKEAVEHLLSQGTCLFKNEEVEKKDHDDTEFLDGITNSRIGRQELINLYEANCVLLPHTLEGATIAAYRKYQHLLDKGNTADWAILDCSVKNEFVDFFMNLKNAHQTNKRFQILYRIPTDRGCALFR